MTLSFRLGTHRRPGGITIEEAADRILADAYMIIDEVLGDHIEDGPWSTRAEEVDQNARKLLARTVKETLTTLLQDHGVVE